MHRKENQHKLHCKRESPFISSCIHMHGETVPEQVAGIKEVLNEDVVIDYKFMDSKI